MIKFGIIMDPIASINIKKDTSFAILLELQRYNYKIYYMEIHDLSFKNGTTYAFTRILNVKKNNEKWYEFGPVQEIALTELDVILMRKDPPFNTEFLYATYLLEYTEKQGTLIINKPKSLRDCNEKIYTTYFPDLIPETVITSNKEVLHSFLKKHVNIIIKPLNLMGGASVFYVTQHDTNFNVIVEMLTHYGKNFCMAQEYLSAIKQGDKRVLIIDGEPVPYCLARIPQNNETRSNLAVGGYGHARPLTEIDWSIASRVAPILKKKGLFFVGLDIIGDKLTEINVTSPTCVQEIEEAYPISITRMLIDAIKKKLS